MDTQEILNVAQEIKKCYQIIRHFANSSDTFKKFANSERFFLYGETYFKQGSFSEKIMDRLICSSTMLPELERRMSKLDKLLKRRNNDELLAPLVSEIVLALESSMIKIDSDKFVCIFDDEEIYKDSVEPIFRVLSLFLFLGDVRSFYDATHKILGKRGGAEFLKSGDSKLRTFLKEIITPFEKTHIHTLNILSPSVFKDYTPLFVDNLYYVKICLDSIVEISRDYESSKIIDEITKYSLILDEKIRGLGEHIGLFNNNREYIAYCSSQDLENNRYTKDKEKILARKPLYPRLIAKVIEEASKRNNRVNDSFSNILHTEISQEIEEVKEEVGIDAPQQTQENIIETKSNKKDNPPYNSLKNSGIQIIKKNKYDPIKVTEKKNQLSKKKKETKKPCDSPITVSPLQDSIEEIPQITLKKKEFRASHFASLVEGVERLRENMKLSSFVAKTHYFNLYFGDMEINVKNKEAFLDILCKAVIVNIMCGFYNPSDADRIHYIQMSHDEKVDAIASSYKKDIKKLLEVILNLGYHPRFAVKEKLKAMLSVGMFIGENGWEKPLSALTEEEAFRVYKENYFGAIPKSVKEREDMWIFSDPIEGDILIKKLYVPQYNLCLLG